jgi:hypothetical protein
MERNHIAPAYRVAAFHCVHCGVLAQMHWAELGVIARGGIMGVSWTLGTCQHCQLDTVWKVNKENVRDVSMVYPHQVNAPAIHEDLPEVCRTDFQEARLTLGVSPRGAAALLRLCLQKLLGCIGGKGEHIDTDIKTLVAAGLDPHIQQALDVIRVTGNNAVHPLDMDPEDVVENVPVLFEMINLIVDERISRQKNINERFARLPEKARLAIEKRDKPNV